MIDAGRVADHLGIDPADTTDAAWLADVADAVNAYVATLPAVADRPTPADPWPATITTGAIMLAAHLYHSRSAPYGRATITADGASVTAYADPEIARLLQLRRWAKPAVGGA